jgi:integrase
MACPQPLRDVATVMIETGMRPQEVYNLKREKIFLEKGYLQIENSKTKSSNRKIWLSEKAAKVLSYRLEKFKGCYLFPKGEKDYNQPIYALNDQHTTTVNRINLKFRLYDCRHTFATRVLESGVDLLTLASMLGHSSLDEVMRYAHPSETRKSDAIQMLQSGRAKAV